MVGVAEIPAPPAHPGVFGLSSVKEEEEVLELDAHGSPSSAGSGGFKGPISLVKSGLDTTDSDTDSSPRHLVHLSPPKRGRLPATYPGGEPERPQAQSEKEREKGLQGKWFRGAKGRRGGSEREAPEEGAPVPGNGAAPRGTAAAASWTAKMIKVSMLQARPKTAAASARAEASEEVSVLQPQPRSTAAAARAPASEVSEADSGASGSDTPGLGKRHFGVTLLLRQWQSTGVNAPDLHRPQTAPSHGRGRRELRDGAPAGGVPLAEIWARMGLDEVEEEGGGKGMEQPELPWEHSADAQASLAQSGPGPSHAHTDTKVEPGQQDHAAEKEGQKLLSGQINAADMEASSNAAQGAPLSAERRRRKLTGRPTLSSGAARPRTAPGKRGASSLGAGAGVGMAPKTQDVSRGRRPAGLGLGSLSFWHGHTEGTLAIHGPLGRSATSEIGPTASEGALGQVGATGRARAKIGRSATVEGDMIGANLVAATEDARPDAGYLPRHQIQRSTSINALSRPDIGCGPHSEEGHESHGEVRQGRELGARGRSVSVHEDLQEPSKSGIPAAQSKSAKEGSDLSHVANAGPGEATHRTAQQDAEGLSGSRASAPTGPGTAQDPRQGQQRSRSLSVNAFSSQQGGREGDEPPKPMPELRAPPVRVRSVSINSGSASAPRVPHHIREAPFAVERMHQWLESQSGHTEQPGQEGPAAEKQQQQQPAATKPAQRKEKVVRSTTMNASHFYPPMMVPGPTDVGGMVLAGPTGTGPNQKAPAMSLVRSHSINSSPSVPVQAGIDSAPLVQSRAPKVPRTLSSNSMLASGEEPLTSQGQSQRQSQGLSGNPDEAEKASAHALAQAPGCITRRDGRSRDQGAELVAANPGVSSHVSEAGAEQGGAADYVMGQPGNVAELPAAKESWKARESKRAAAAAEASNESVQAAPSSGNQDKGNAGKPGQGGDQGTGSQGLFLQRFLMGPASSLKKLHLASRQTEARGKSAKGEPLLAQGSDSLTSQASAGESASTKGLNPVPGQSSGWGKSRRGGAPSAGGKAQADAKSVAVNAVRSAEDESDFRIQKLLQRQRALSIRPSDFSQPVVGTSTIQGGPHVHSRTLSDMRGSQGNLQYTAGQPGFSQNARTQSLHGSPRLERSDSGAVRDARKALQRGNSNSGNNSAALRGGPKAAPVKPERLRGQGQGHGQEASRPRTAGSDRASSAERGAKHRASEAQARPRTAVPRSTSVEPLSSPRIPPAAHAVGTGAKPRVGGDTDARAQRALPRSITVHSSSSGAQHEVGRAGAGESRDQPADANYMQQFSDGLVRGSSRKLLVRSDSTSIFRDLAKGLGGSEGGPAQSPRRGRGVHGDQQPGRAREMVASSRGPQWGGQGEDVHSKVQAREEREAALRLQGAPSREAWFDQPDWVARLSASRSLKASSTSSSNRALPLQTKSEERAGPSSSSRGVPSAACTAQAQLESTSAKAESYTAKLGSLADGGKAAGSADEMGTASGYSHNEDPAEMQSGHSIAANPQAEHLPASEDPVLPPVIAIQGLWKLQGADSSSSAAELDTISVASPMAATSALGSPLWSARSSPARHTGSDTGGAQEGVSDAAAASPGRNVMEEPFRAPAPGPRYRSKRIVWGPSRRNSSEGKGQHGEGGVPPGKGEGAAGSGDVGGEGAESNRGPGGEGVEVPPQSVPRGMLSGENEVPAGQVEAPKSVQACDSELASGELRTEGREGQGGLQCARDGSGEKREDEGEGEEEKVEAQGQMDESASRQSTGSEVPKGVEGGDEGADEAGEADATGLEGTGLAAMQDGEDEQAALKERNDEAPASPIELGSVATDEEHTLFPALEGAEEADETRPSLGDLEPEAGLVEGVRKPEGDGDDGQLGVSLDTWLGSSWQDSVDHENAQIAPGPDGQHGVEEEAVVGPTHKHEHGAEEQGESLWPRDGEPSESQQSLEPLVAPTVEPSKAEQSIVLSTLPLAALSIDPSAEESSPGILSASYGESMEGGEGAPEQDSESWSPRESVSEERWDRRPLPLTPALFEAEWSHDGSATMEVSMLDLHGTRGEAGCNGGATGPAEQGSSDRADPDSGAYGALVDDVCSVADDAALVFIAGGRDTGFAQADLPGATAPAHAVKEWNAAVDATGEVSMEEGGVQEARTKEGGTEELSAGEGGVDVLRQAVGGVEEACSAKGGTDGCSTDEDETYTAAPVVAVELDEVHATSEVSGHRVYADGGELFGIPKGEEGVPVEEQASEDDVEEEECEEEEEEEYNYWQEYMQTKETVRPAQDLGHAGGAESSRDGGSPYRNEGSGRMPVLETVEESKGEQEMDQMEEERHVPQMQPVEQALQPGLAPAGTEPAGVALSSEQGQGGGVQAQLEGSREMQKKALRQQLQHLLLLQLQQLQAQLLARDEGEGQDEQMLEMLMQIQQQMQLNAQLL